MNARNLRSAFTLLEMMIVVGIIFLMTAIGFSTSQELIPRFKARQAAQEAGRHIEMARQFAMTERVEYRILLVEYDEDISDVEKPVKGLYRIQRGNRATGSTLWDTLPFEAGADDNLIGEGTVDLAKGGNSYKKGVSLGDWGTISGPGNNNDNAIVIGPRGMVTNPASDFNGGFIELPFANKMVLTKETSPEYFNVHINRSGMVRIETSKGNEYPTEASGTPHNTTWDNSEGTSPSADPS